MFIQRKKRSIRFLDSEWEAVVKKAKQEGFNGPSEYVRARLIGWVNESNPNVEVDFSTLEVKVSKILDRFDHLEAIIRDIPRSLKSENQRESESYTRSMLTYFALKVDDLLKCQSFDDVAEMVKFNHWVDYLDDFIEFLESANCLKMTKRGKITWSEVKLKEELNKW